MNASKVKARPPDGPRYACGHRAYVISPRIAAVLARVPCSYCAERNRS